MEANQARCVAIDGELQALVGGQERLSEMIDDQVALKSLARLANVMKLANPTALNIQLAHHIDTIEADRDRRIVIRTCRLGVFEGLEVLLAGTASPRRELVDSSGSLPLKGTVVTPRQRARLRHEGTTIGPSPAATCGRDIHDPDRFARLGGRWFWEDHIELPAKRCWSELNAERVLELRQKNDWTHRRLSEELGKSIPTIRKALKIARERMDA